MAKAKKKKATRKKKCQHGVNKRTKKCLKHPRKKMSAKGRAKGKRARETMDWLVGDFKPTSTRSGPGGTTVRTYSPADSMKAIYGSGPHNRSTFRSMWDMGTMPWAARSKVG